MLRTTGDQADLIIDVTDKITKLPFDGSAHDWFLAVQTKADYDAKVGDLTFAEVDGVYTYSAGASGYATFPISSTNALLLLAGTTYIFEIWYNEAGASPAKNVFVDRFQVKMVPRNFEAPVVP